MLVLPETQFCQSGECFTTKLVGRHLNRYESNIQVSAHGGDEWGNVSCTSVVYRKEEVSKETTAQVTITTVPSFAGLATCQVWPGGRERMTKTTSMAIRCVSEKQVGHKRHLIVYEYNWNKVMPPCFAGICGYALSSTSVPDPGRRRCGSFRRFCRKVDRLCEHGTSQGAVLIDTEPHPKANNIITSFGTSLYAKLPFNFIAGNKGYSLTSKPFKPSNKGRYSLCEGDTKRPGNTGVYYIQQTTGTFHEVSSSHSQQIERYHQHP
ncbi:hypothetical protein V8F33_008832 [Rhypophila sp. PSN 637]